MKRRHSGLLVASASLVLVLAVFVFSAWTHPEDERDRGLLYYKLGHSQAEWQLAENRIAVAWDEEVTLAYVPGMLTEERISHVTWDGATPCEAPAGTYRATLTSVGPGDHLVRLQVKLAGDPPRSVERAVTVTRLDRRSTLDLTGDSRVDRDDHDFVWDCMGNTRDDPGYEESADINRDGRVDLRDLVAYVDAIGNLEDDGGIPVTPSAVDSEPLLPPNVLPMEIGPIAGLTTQWHISPTETSIPAGTTVRLRVPALGLREVIWTGAKESFRDGRVSIAELVLTVRGEHTVNVEARTNDGMRLENACLFRVVDIAPADISVGPVTGWVESVDLNRESSNEDRMGYLLSGESIAELHEVDTDRYATSVDRRFFMKVSVDPKGFAPLIEWRVDGTPANLLGSSLGSIQPGDAEEPWMPTGSESPGWLFADVANHSISVGPVQTPQQIELETYSVTVESKSTSHNPFPEGKQITLEASTDPPGFESDVMWISSTKYGSADPVMGQGATFTVVFDDTWGPRLVPGTAVLSQHLGVRADNAVIEQVQEGGKLIEAPQTTASITVEIWPDPPSVIELETSGQGDTEIMLDSPPYTTGEDIETELVSLELAGTSAEYGRVLIHERLDKRSLGLITDVQARPDGTFLSGRSVFDVYVEVELPDLGVTANSGVVPVQLVVPYITELPPFGESYFPETETMEIPLYVGYERVGTLVHAEHTICPPPDKVVETFCSFADVIIEIFPDPPIPVLLDSTGPDDTEVELDPPPYTTGVDIETEITKLDLEGTTEMYGPVLIRERLDKDTMGHITNVVAKPDGTFLSGDSWFGVYVEVELPQLGLVATSGEVPVELVADDITRLPPYGDSYLPPGEPVLISLYVGDVHVGYILHAMHSICPPPEIVGTIEAEEIVPPPMGGDPRAPRDFTVSCSWTYPRGIQQIRLLQNGVPVPPDPINCGGAAVCANTWTPVSLNEGDVLQTTVLTTDGRSDEVKVRPIRNTTEDMTWVDYLCVDSTVVLQCGTPTVGPVWDVLTGQDKVDPDSFAGSLFSVTGVDTSSSEKDVMIRYQATDPDGDAGRSIWNITVCAVDLDIDSDNTSYLPGHPQRDELEDAIEDDAELPGRLLMVNNDDEDEDQVWDYGDGYNLDGIPGNEDDLNDMEDEFIAIVFDVLPPIDLDDALVRIAYDASYPAAATIEGDPPRVVPAPGQLRIWRVSGELPRSKEVAPAGDFVAPQVYEASEIGLTNANRTVTFWMEAIHVSDGAGDDRIVFEVDPDGDGPAEYCSDAVRTTIIDLQYVTKDEDGESIIDQEYSYNSVPCPVIESNVLDCTISAAGVVTMSLSGTVTDEASDLVDEPESQIQTLEISPESQYTEVIELVNTASPELPWKPYRFGASFSTSVDVVTNGFGPYQVSLVTSENVAGCRGELTHPIVVSIRQETKRENVLLFSVPDDAVADSLVFFTGETDPGIDDGVLHETGLDTNIFTGTLFWADVEVEAVALTGLTGQVDTLLTGMTFTYSNGLSKEYEIDFIETGAVTSHFATDLSEAIDGLDLGGLLNLALPPSFEGGSPDEVQTYIGDHDPGPEDFPLTETGDATLLFNGDATWGDATVELIDFGGLTGTIDLIETEWVFVAPDGTVDVLDVEMIETGPDTRRFTYDLGQQNVFDVVYGEAAQNEPGTFLPTIIRIDGPSDLPTSDLSVATFDRDWALERKDLGDGPYWYVIDYGMNAVVFLPAAYAESHIQTKPLEETFTNEIRKGGVKLGKTKVKVETGLVVERDDVANMLGNITNDEKREYRRGTEKVFIYAPKPGMELGHSNNDLDTEILWRYIGTKKTVSVFSFRSDLEKDISYRQKVVESATAFAIPFGSPPKVNPAFWINATTVRAGKSATDAINDMFTAGAANRYKLACLLAALYVTERGAAHALGKPVFDARVGRRPYDKSWDVVQRGVSQPNGGSNDHANNAKWIPGDWGYIDNTDPAAGGLITGENVIYMGGCFDTDLGDFKDNADFWGHVGANPVKKFKAWITTVEGWDGNANNGSAKILSYRDYLKP